VADYQPHNPKNWILVARRKLKCKMAGCNCQAFSYVPVKGSGDLLLDNDDSAVFKLMKVYKPLE
jgi:hypothetical protein